MSVRRRTWLLILLGACTALIVWALWAFRPRAQPALVYFVRWDPATNAGQLVPGLRWVYGRTRSDWVAAAVRELLRGPNPKERALGYSSEIPPGTRLLGVRIRGQTAYVNLSRPFESGGGSASMLARLYQVVYTVTHFPGVQEVRIEIEGQLRDSLGGEGLLVDLPVRRPPSAPRF
ncbi:MAG: hypothetical protein C4304_00065 [candidate division GAL15 bacterium]